LKNGNVSKPFYRKTWFVVVCVVAVLGVIGLFTKNTRNDEVNYAASSQFATMTTLTTSAATTQNTTLIASATTTTTTTIPVIDTPAYEIVNVENVDVGNAVRLNLNVVVNDECNVEQLEQIASEVIEEAKEKTPFNAAIVFFYDYAEYIGHGMTLGKSVYAPDGDFGKAMDVKTGRYESMKYTNTFYDKDWGKRLTPEEAAIWKQWMDLYKEKDVGDYMQGLGDIVTREIADKTGLTEKQVSDIMDKQAAWVMMM
jgi:hypothetical protein